MRSAGMGGIIGFDMPAFLQAAEVKGYDPDTMLPLLSDAEAGLLEAMKERSESRSE